MSSVNPIFLLPAALASAAEAIGTAFVDSLTLGVGQFCTNPGLVFAVDGPALRRFEAAAKAALSVKPSATMLNAGIAAAYADGRKRLSSALEGAIAEGLPSSKTCSGQPALFRATGSQYLASPKLAEENFGPSSLIVACTDFAQMLEIAHQLDGQLTSTLHLTPKDAEDLACARTLLPVLERKAGRLVINGFPTGVEVGNAIVHGGPYPATTDSRTSSVGTKAMERFLRPVCYQNYPQALLPPALQDSNPLGVVRRRDGVLGNH